jgi:hypothetical protein
LLPRPLEASTIDSRLVLAVEATELGFCETATGALFWSDRMKALYGLEPGAPVTFEALLAGRRSRPLPARVSARAHSARACARARRRGRGRL